MSELNQNFTESERKIIQMGKESKLFNYNNNSYEILKIGKPVTGSGEPKTDIYILAENKLSNELTEFKISFKQDNADFLENKIKQARAMQIFGQNWSDIISRSTLSLFEKFNQRKLVYKTKHGRTEENSITLGWRFELVNKDNGELSSQIVLSTNQKLDILRGGDNLDISKKRMQLLMAKK